jgi:mRNA interferase RelE/StbE
MVKYTVVLTRQAQKQLDKLSDQFAVPILKAIGALEANPRPKGYKKLKGRDGYRIKSGEYRIIYEIYDRQLVVDVIALGHRKDIYR